MSEILTGRVKATHKWLGDDGGWRVGFIVAHWADKIPLVQEYHTGEIYWVQADCMSAYPESPIPEPEART